MQTIEFSITEKNLNKIFYKKLSTYKNTNTKKIKLMKEMLFKMIESELTENQKKCIIDYYVNGKKEKEIALDMGIDPSTVSRHISAGKKKLKRVASYFA